MVEWLLISRQLIANLMPLLPFMASERKVVVDPLDQITETGSPPEDVLADTAYGFVCQPTAG